MESVHYWSTSPRPIHPSSPRRPSTQRQGGREKKKEYNITPASSNDRGRVSGVDLHSPHAIAPPNTPVERARAEVNSRRGFPMNASKAEWRSPSLSSTSLVASPLQRFIEENPLVFERCVLPLLSSTDRGLLARTSRGCKGAVAASGLNAAGCLWPSSSGAGRVLTPFVGECFLVSNAMLDWARDNGCPWQGRIHHIATTRGCMRALNWAVERGYEWQGYRRIIIRHALRCQQWNVVDWAWEQGCRP